MNINHSINNDNHNNNHSITQVIEGIDPTDRQIYNDSNIMNPNIKVSSSSSSSSLLKNDLYTNPSRPPSPSQIPPSYSSNELTISKEQSKEQPKEQSKEQEQKQQKMSRSSSLESTIVPTSGPKKKHHLTFSKLLKSKTTTDLNDSPSQITPIS